MNTPPASSKFEQPPTFQAVVKVFLSGFHSLLRSKPINIAWLVLLLLCAALFYLLPSGSAVLLGSLIVLAGLSALLASRTTRFIFDRELSQLLARPENAALELIPSAKLLLPELSAALVDSCNRLTIYRAEKDMLLSRYQVLTENLAAAIFIRNAQGRLAYCSPYTEVLTGYSVDEMYESEQDFFLSIVHPEDQEKYQRALKVSAYGEAFQFRYRFIHKTGLEMWAETRTVPILDAEGTVLSSLSITLDVTGTIRYQQQVEEKNRDLEDFTYMVSHDLKAPIFTIKGMVQVLEEDFLKTLPAELKEILGHIGSASKRLETLVTGVLEYSRISRATAPQQIVYLDAVLSEVAQDFAPQLNSAGGSLSIASGLPAVVGDQRMIYQIFSNLVGNAIKYRSPQRAVEINITPAGSKNSRYTAISIKDNGLGIPADKLDQIFRPFQRAHGKEIEGSGIGLACVKKLLEKIAGEISVQSTVAAGTEFQVVLRQASINPASEIEA